MPLWETIEGFVGNFWGSHSSAYFLNKYDIIIVEFSS